MARLHLHEAHTKVERMLDHPPSLRTGAQMGWLRIGAICAVLFIGADLATAAEGPANPDEKRVALVIGSAAYGHIGALRTPINDAKAVANGLRQLRFTDVLEGYDLGIEAMSTMLGTFGARAEGADWAVIYYAGHGLEVG